MGSDNHRHLKLTFKGESFADGRVPLNVLAAKLRALQNLLFHAAAAVAKDPSLRRGLWYNRYREAVELSFTAAHHSDLVIEVETPPPGPTLLPEADVALQSIDLVFDVGRAIEPGGKASNLPDLRPIDKTHLLRAFESLVPNALDQYMIKLENWYPDKHQPLELTGGSHEILRQLLEKDTLPTLDEKATIVGELVKIHFDTGPEKITVRQHGVEIDCFYPESLRDEVTNLLAGSYVEVTGLGTVNASNQLIVINRVVNLETVSMEPLRLSRFEHSAIRYNLKTPIQVQVEYADGLWVYRNEALNLWGTGERREDALADLHANFAYLWREFAEESDEVLDEKAMALKYRLLELEA